MRLLTGSQNKSFQFVPESIASFGPTVLVEGCDRDCSISWVHAWTVASGVVTGVREYFNTTLTVTRLGNNSRRNSPASSDAVQEPDYVRHHCLADLHAVHCEEGLQWQDIASRSEDLAIGIGFCLLLQRLWRNA
ncbi:wound-induced protein 1-like [Pyrus ussuriensis x Pyrus communis]|uniref:Wound-induced protein 1-like n=1 Tax=Pyrus ussuriensis x Pyrus communis TaxID=2448454 RepID=A0A5N5H517_9ROSA|nr:wound-induced protein 1-like [Pyrus ussuriensis x Pyrus communis]